MITSQDYILAFGDRDLAGSDGEINEEAFAWARDAALGTINAYLMAVKLSAFDERIQGEVKTQILDITRYNLNNDKVTDIIKERKDDAVKFFSDVAKGLAVIVSEADEKPASQSFRVVSIVRS